MASTVSESERFKQAVDTAVAAVGEGDRVLVAADWAAENFSVEHRFDELHQRVQEEVEDET